MEQKKIFNIFPVYSIPPIAAMLGMNCLAYFGTRIINAGRTHYNIESALDLMLPVVPFFVVFYILAFAQWIICYILIGLQKKEYCYYFFLGEILAKIMCLVIFLAFPTTMSRPEITGTGIFDRLLNLVYSLDAPDNLFPSIHCLESYLLARTLPLLKKAPRWYKIITWPVSILVFASVLFVKQHVIVDVFSAIAAVEIGILLSKLIFREKK